MWDSKRNIGRETKVHDMKWESVGQADKSSLPAFLFLWNETDQGKMEGLIACNLLVVRPDPKEGQWAKRKVLK